jgi:hypothetical protein
MASEYKDWAPLAFHRDFLLGRANAKLLVGGGRGTKPTLSILPYPS